MSPHFTRVKPFLRFLLKKVLVFIGIFIFSSCLLFILPRLMPSNPVELMIARTLSGEFATGVGGTAGGASAIAVREEIIKVLREVYTEKFGLDKPIEQQFLLLWKRVFTLDFGVSYSYYPSPVSDVILSSLPWTLMLIAPVPIIGFFVGNSIGSRTATKPGKFSNLAFFAALYTNILPYYWFALILVYIFAVNLKIFPLCGAYSERWVRPVWNNLNFILDVAHHYVLPLLSLIWQGIGGWAVGMRAAMLSQIRLTYTDYMKNLGFSFNTIRKRMQRNAILPNFTWLPMAFSGLISQTLLVEVVFGYPGVGSIMYSAAYSLDYPLLEASFLIIILLVVFGNLICDIVYGLLDPTIGSSYVSGEA